MKSDTHSRLLTFLCIVLVVSGMVTAAAVNARPDSTAPRSGDDITEAFDLIVPGMTQADDLPALGFDAASARTAMLPPAEILRRFPDTRQAAIADCVHAGLYCTGFVFPAANKAKVTLLVMNGRVVHKVFEGGAQEPAPGLTPTPLRHLAALARDFL